MIKSISYNQEEIISNILKLHCCGNIELDTTYSSGNFYKGNITPPMFKMDSEPQMKGVAKVTGANIPLPNESINTAMFDPPFLATKGKSLNQGGNSNKTVKRFGYYPDELSLHSFYQDALKEFHRVLKPNGVLIFKCQDKVSSGKQYWSHVFVMNEAIKIGYYVKDLFILLAKNRITAKWQLVNQKHARKFHSYFLVLQKSNRKVNYIVR